MITFTQPQKKMIHALSDLVALIPHPQLRKLTDRVLTAAPTAFWQAPASTSGKYHPAECRQRGGLVKHTRAVFVIAKALMAAFGYTEKEDRYSVVLAGALLHDSHKVLTPEALTTFEHPLLAAAVIGEQADEMSFTNLAVVPELQHVVAAHMGHWNTSRHSDTKLPLPESEAALILHLADLIPSRPQVHVDTEPKV